MLDELKSGLSDRYTIVRELGAGGMATVYLAHDVRHDRDVALKVLHSDLAGALGAERFLTEIRLCARLQHPHILTVHDSGETNGHLWFTMPYVEGESLRDRLHREKQLPVDEAVRITREAAEALDYAHRHGVIHRDVKPENILLAEGHALVADFGIGRALSPGQQRLTATGLSLGTPAYMSPEQAAGDRDVDARSDIYSLATVLYEMLSGETPFAGPTSQSIIARRFTETAQPLRLVRESVPESVERAVAKALSRTPADRFASAAEFGRALSAPAIEAPAADVAPPTSRARRARRGPSPALTMLGLGFLLGAGVLFAWRERASKAVAGSAERLIAVLPFENEGDAANEYFADGIADEVRGKLSALSGLRVIAGGSSREYKKTTKSLSQIGHELGVQYLLVGRVQWAKDANGANRVLVSPELVELAGGKPMTRWEQPFDTLLTDVFKVQAAIATKVASALDVALGDSTRRTIAAAPTANLAAYDAFLKGDAASQEMAVADPPSLRRAIGYYEQAVRLDSGFARAWSRLSRAKAALYFNAVPEPELGRAAHDAAERAEALAPGQPDGAVALGFYYGSVEGKVERMLSTLEAQLPKSPNDVELLTYAGIAEQATGQWERATQHLAQARSLDPRSTAVARRLGDALVNQRRYREARVLLDSALAIVPTNLQVIDARVMAALGEGDLTDARTVLQKASTVVEPQSLLPFMGIYQDLYWVLDDAQQQQLLSMPVSAFDNDRSTRALVLAETYYARGDQSLSRAYGDTAERELALQVQRTPGDAQRRTLHGLALAYAGRNKAEAVAEGVRGVQLEPISRDALVGPYLQHQLARIYALVGEPEKALDTLEPLFKMPYYLSPAWLRIDPEFAMLKGNPRFERLIAGR